jgi:Zn finger protein HypA/HybF involved in hydrogenase expression
VNNLPDVTVHIRVGQSYTRCNNCYSHYLKATLTGFVCSHCGKLFNEPDFISLMKDAYSRELEVKKGVIR